MMKEMTLLKQLEAVSEGQLDVTSFAQMMRTFNQGYIQSAMQAVYENAQEDLNEILKSYRRTRKAMADMQKADKEVIVYECGIFNGAYKILEDLRRFNAEQEEFRNSLELLNRKHVLDILNYLYNNPYERHGNIATNINISPSHLTEILNILMDKGYVDRNGKNKGTRYYLTRLGRQNSKLYVVQRKAREDYIDTVEFKEIPMEEEYMKIPDKEKFSEERFSEYRKTNLKKEGRYDSVESKNYFGSNTEIAGYR